ncbi:molybdenum cofactor guanylyltransferase [Texcoconibacillus texcoconensis]|uniref:Probable molybdenum cofactor guanylyltransferase n=1 Tax=Texcoconibacillus texcoconensis TaxID=1095777 RepID=A0A840QN70_9BACI|nr:molybdenum cofactor guanylyltransferase [Texcoconibacillus texcoconensis]MBB5172832.1 molybdopterin-guanine dinucleotide biosynthesis protein A [Texcoconibacillus texcoconensis]
MKTNDFPAYDLTALILAGGASSRMGTNKAFLQIGSESIIERIDRAVSPVASRVNIVANEKEKYQFLGRKVVSDHYVKQGPLAGLEAGLSSLETQWAFVAACDMPLVSTRLAETMYSFTSKRDVDVVLPVISGKHHPLFALYHQRILPKVRNCLEQGERRMFDVLKDVSVVEVDESSFIKSGWTEEDVLRSFFNMNHPEDFEKAKQWLADQK